MKVDYTKDYYISEYKSNIISGKSVVTSSVLLVGFQPNASMNVAHHMLMYGCGDVGSTKPVWNCGEMSKKENDQEETASVCKPGAHSQV